MKAVRYYSKKDIRVEDVAAPSGPLGDDMVLIEPLVCGICGTDLHEYIAGPIVTPATPNVYSGATLPQILGHEFSARVLDVGKKVTHVSPGSRVSIQPLISPRDDYYGRRGLFHLSENMAVVGLSRDWGGMGERAVINGYNAIPVPDTVSDVQAAMIEPAAVALYGVDRGGVTSGSSVLVSGVGPIGALVLLAAKAAGATKIFVSELNPNRRAWRNSSFRRRSSSIRAKRIRTSCSGSRRRRVSASTSRSNASAPRRRSIFAPRPCAAAAPSCRSACMCGRPRSMRCSGH